MAANEWPLYTLIREYQSRLPILSSVQEHLEKQLVYADDFVPPAETDRLVVIDLGKRNHLQKEFFHAALDALLRERLYEQCPRCPAYKYCDTTRNRRLLANPLVAERLSDLISRIAVMGYHVTVRELLSMLSFLVFGGRTCMALARYSDKRRGFYSDQLFDPDAHGEIFDLLRQYVDPATISHPIWDSRLYYNDHASSDWVDAETIETIYSDKRVDLGEREKKFSHMKRRFYFEHTKGDDVLSMLPEDERDFYRWVNPDNDDLDTVLDEVLEAVNLFFCPVLETGQMRERLFVWTAHQYDERVPKAFLCVQTAERRNDEIVIQRPQLAPHLRDAYTYYPDHVRLVAYPNRSNSPYLTIDFALFKMLRDVQRGLPPMLVPEEAAVRLYQFMNAVHAVPTKRRQDRQLVRSYVVGSNYVLQVTVRGSRPVLVEKLMRTE